MSTLRERQQQLMHFLLGDDESGITSEVSEQSGISAAHRLSIYRNAYRSRLLEAIDTDHEILGLYLGDDMFDQMVANYIDQYPSHFRSLRNFADRLPLFLSQAEPFSNYPQISELARFERALLTAFDAADMPRATLEALQQIPEHHWPEMKLNIHPSVQPFVTDYNVVEIWQAIKQEQQPPNPEQQPRLWVLWRNADRLTEFTSIEPLEYSLLESFLKGATLSEAADDAIELIDPENAAEQLLHVLVGWLQRGWIYRLRTPDQTSDLSAV